jgi:hypothetical protein
MFGFGKKKIKTKVDEPAEAPKVLVYEVASESNIHVMPAVFKQLRQDSKQAHKTGLVIFVLAGFLVFLAIAALAYYWLKPPVTKAPILSTPEASSSEVVPANQPPTPVEVATTSVTVPVVVEVPLVPVATSTEPLTKPIETTPRTQATDLDNDGLLDPEEVLLGTNFSKPDSDGDGFSDGDELAKGFNPAGPGKLSANTHLLKFDNTNFSFLYPVGWTFKSSGNDLVVFTSPDNQLIQVSLQPNIKNQTVVEWYREQFATSTIESAQQLTKKDTDGSTVWNGVRNIDRTTYYLVDALKQNIVTIDYNLGPNNKLDYPNLVAALVMSYQPKYGGN